MARVYDLLEEPVLPRDAVVARLRELAASPAMPDPRIVPYRPSRRRLGDLTKGLILLAAIIGMWWSTIELMGLLK